MTKPKNCIKVTDARQMHQNWIKTRGNQLDVVVGSVDKREFLFSLEEMQEFLNYVKTNTNGQEAGIRIYFAAYDEKNKGEATVFLAPTLGIGPTAENNYDLEPLNKGVCGNPPKAY